MNMLQLRRRISRAKKEKVSKIVWGIIQPIHGMETKVLNYD